MEPLIKVVRNISGQDSTTSQCLVRGKRECFGVEDEVRKVKVKGETAVWAGTYPLGLRQSPKFSKYFWTKDGINLVWHADVKNKTGYRAHDLIWVKDVPQFEYILIHWGNTDKDTDGCYIVGSAYGKVNGREGVTGSRAAYVKLYAQVVGDIGKGGQFIQYVNAAH